MGFNSAFKVLILLDYGPKSITYAVFEFCYYMLILLLLVWVCWLWFVFYLIWCKIGFGGSCFRFTLKGVICIIVEVLVAFLARNTTNTANKLRVVHDYIVLHDVY